MTQHDSKRTALCVTASQKRDDDHPCWMGPDIQEKPSTTTVGDTTYAVAKHYPGNAVMWPVGAAMSRENSATRCSTPSIHLPFRRIKASCTCSSPEWIPNRSASRYPTMVRNGKSCATRTPAPVWVSRCTRIDCTFSRTFQEMAYSTCGPTIGRALTSRPTATLLRCRYRAYGLGYVGRQRDYGGGDLNGGMAHYRRFGCCG